MKKIGYISNRSIAKITNSLDGVFNAKILTLVADICRLNTLVEIRKAGSGHIGTCFSAMDILTYLYHYEMNVKEVGIDSIDRDIFFSSKGHDVPAQYSVLYSLGIYSDEKFMSLRRLGGLYGHPEVVIDGIEANTGSLGMGISKARGISRAKKLKNLGGRVFVMTGDGELQEGQIWESLQTSSFQGDDFTVIVDHNKIQSDMPVCEITDLGPLDEKFRLFGFHCERIDGHDLNALHQAILNIAEIKGPKVILCDTIKGRGVSLMEKIEATKTIKGKFNWHSGAPDEASFQIGYDELWNRIESVRENLNLPPFELVEVQLPKKGGAAALTEIVAKGFGDGLVELAEEIPELFVLSADLSMDCQLRPFEMKYPERFQENGIAEMDMVSMAGGLALQGFVPVVNSFACFLVSRANEQIYNNACENTKIIYAGHFAGMLPPGPGKSHQSVRDISLMGAIPNMLIVQPATASEAAFFLKYAVQQENGSSYIRMNIGPSKCLPTPSEAYTYANGQGYYLAENPDAEVLIFSYGPAMLNEALLASEILNSSGIASSVMNMPWLNRMDGVWLREMAEKHRAFVVVEDHMQYGGLGSSFSKALHEMRCKDCDLLTIGLEEYPECGTPAEVLAYHRLDANGIVERIVSAFDYHHVDLKKLPHVEYQPNLESPH